MNVYNILATARQNIHTRLSSLATEVSEAGKKLSSSIKTTFNKLFTKKKSTQVQKPVEDPVDDGYQPVNCTCGHCRQCKWNEWWIASEVEEEQMDLSGGDGLWPLMFDLNDFMYAQVTMVEGKFTRNALREELDVELGEVVGIFQIGKYWSYCKKLDDSIGMIPTSWLRQVGNPYVKPGFVGFYMVEFNGNTFSGEWVYEVSQDEESCGSESDLEVQNVEESL